MRSDDDIKRDVEERLRWNPEIDATDIAVAARRGVVMLTGFVREYSQIWLAEDAAKRVPGVAGVANDIKVRFVDTDPKPDPDIARDAIAAIRFYLPSVADQIRVTVADAWLTLEGEVQSDYLRERVENAIRAVRGIKGVTNAIRVRSEVMPT